MAIGHAARAINPQLAVEYLTLDEFVEAFHAAIAAGHGEAYRKRFLDVDVLLVDDVQFLTHRREMQAELLRLTDALQTTNRQIVLTSDRPPAEIGHQPLVGLQHLHAQLGQHEIERACLAREPARKILPRWPTRLAS